MPRTSSASYSSLASLSSSGDFETGSTNTGAIRRAALVASARSSRARRSAVADKAVLKTQTLGDGRRQAARFKALTRGARVELPPRDLCATGYENLPLLLRLNWLMPHGRH